MQLIPQNIYELPVKTNTLFVLLANKEGTENVTCRPAHGDIPARSNMTVKYEPQPMEIDAGGPQENATASVNGVRV